jgi:Domain of unknown function (DUF932)
MSNRAGRHETGAGPDEDVPKWFGEPVQVSEGPPEDLLKLVPRFDRRPFAMSSVGSRSIENVPTQSVTGENDQYDLIVRLPLNKQEAEMPVGIVSKHYTLVQHLEVIGRASEAIKIAGLKLDRVTAELTLSASGSKMAFTFTLPESFDFDPGDKLILKLRFHCVNSVDGQCRLKIMLGWYRFVCGNGLVVGTSRLDQRFIHNEYLKLPDMTRVLSEGLEAAKNERASLTEWVAKRVEESRLDKWSDGPLLDEWGPLAAARVHLICMTGRDGRFARQAEKAPPHRKGMIRTAHVPGAPPKAENAYHVAQALAWVARSKKDIQDQLDGMVAIPKLMNALLK